VYHSPAVFYSFSFAQNPDWTQFHPNGPEIVSYLQDVTEKYKVLDKIQLDTEVMECRWNEEQHVWHIKLQHYQPEMGDLSKSDRDRKVEQEGHAAVYGKEEHIKAKVLVSCAGGLVEPKSWPDNIPGRDKFQGQIFHSARWRYDVDLKDKEVVVVGTGCSAAQFVPKLTSEYGAKKVTQIMRSPPWVIPRPEPPGGEEHFNKVAPWRNRYIPGHQQLMRWMNASLSEWDWRLFGNSEWNKKQRATLEKQLIAHMQTTVPQKYWEMLTPNYAVCGKRRIFDATWFPGLRDPRIELTTLPLQTLNEDSVTLGPKRTYPDPANTASQVPNEPVTIPADVIILANGFDVVKWLDPITVIGRGGKNLHAVQQERGGPQMYLGTAMDSFPNFFAIFGPNTATGHTSVILAAENGINLVLKLVKGVLEGEVEEVEVKEEAERRWARMMQEGNRKTVFHQDGVRSWYRTEGGWNSTTYP
jgi:cation diffusion facilitator CzcD-associated flavoprotein CzcO